MAGRRGTVNRDRGGPADLSRLAQRRVRLGQER